MDSQVSGVSPSKNHLSQWWKQIRNNPKSMSSDSLSVSNSDNLRPVLMSHSRSFNNSRRPASPPSNPNSEEYRSYRDSFLSSRNQFMGQVFGVPLSQSLSVASAEVIVQSELVSFGRIPILVAKCGAFLKSKALQTSGIFRIAGNNKRVKELQYIFSAPPSYGTKLSDWDGFTVHDAASLLRRYLNNLEEPLVPLSMYEQFRKPLQDRPRILKHLAQGMVKDPALDAGEPKATAEVDKEKAQMKAVRHKKRLTRDIRAALKEYEVLFSSLSSDSKQLLIYLLDLLSLFAQQSDVNLMTARNLAAVFQPSIMSHPQHDMDPNEYELSRVVVEFLIEYSYKLLPHLLKNSRAVPQTIVNEPAEDNCTQSKANLAIPIPQTIVSPDPESVISRQNGCVSPATPTEQTTKSLDSAQLALTPPSPSFLDKPRNVLKNRPHSKSLSHTLNPSDIISGRRNSRLSWLNRVLSNDTEFTGTEEECEEEEEEDVHSPMSINSGSVPKQTLLALPKPKDSRSMSGSSAVRPFSEVINKSFEELGASLGLRGDSNTDNSPLFTDEESDSRARSRSIRRNSWFERLRSRSRSAKRS
ncbi:LANO_0H21484g1_1 [Lachancea nothofagi CBS 11611]|uniref:LANO_0H21484g1_1 n=1 Tax=Lachancea nothofagi CBS 11611 TaxID=1266666 RepID=A0A1G4KNN0_9SACH|nr:LANO_0H21484g1_1 [Lachancea nothofagi CBS 11611]